ncbi:hypothetical protein Gotur_029285 [Gossypium turneri]
MARLPLIVQSERRKRIGLALTVWLQMFTVAILILLKRSWENDYLVIEDDEPNIVNIHPSDAWATWRMKVANQMFYE